MDVKALNCPACGGSFQASLGTKSLYCPYCGTMIKLTYEESEKKEAAGTVFTDQKTGAALASAAVPEGWRTSGSYTQVKIDEITPFGISVSALSPDGMMSLGARYGEHWYHFLINGLLQNAYPKKQWKKYLEPDEYLQEIAERIAGTNVKPVSCGPINTLYNQNRSAYANRLVSRFEESAHINLPNIQIELRLQNLLCEAQGMLSKYTKDGREWVILTGADLFGLEIYDAAPMGKLNRGMTKGLTAIFDKAKKKEEFEPGEFGHAKDEGKPVDMIEWGSKRMYFAVAPAEKEKEALNYFMNFIMTFKQDEALDKALDDYHRQVYQQEVAQLQNAANYAMQSQIMNIQRTQQISQTLSETSNIVMQGWNNRMASQDRISKNWSEAIRGVNSFSTTDGRTVEHSVVSDHVYQNSYGDTIGVSGNLQDVPVGWTELERKD